MAQSLDKKTQISKAPLRLSMKALLYCLLFALLAILPGFLIGTKMAGLLHKWSFLYSFIDATNYFPINNTTVLLVIVTLCILTIASIFAFLSSKLPQEIQKEHGLYWTIFAAISALFLIIMGIYVSDKSYIVLGTTSSGILIPIALYAKNTLKVFFIVCILTFMVIGSAIIKAHNIKSLHHTKNFNKIFLKQESA